ncbi:MAG: SIMPL domain-containing protein, partial [Planctomycetota bacterium]
MKKILASLLVLALCAPAMAATITVEDIGGGQATITVATEGEEANIVGLGLDVVVTGGEVTAVSVDTANFNIFPDYAYFLETDEDPNGYEYGEGHPVAAMLEAGKLELPQSSFALSLGNLNGEETPGADGATEVVITVDWSGDLLEVCENATRGGIVANGEEAGIPLDAECAELEGGCAIPTCLFDFNGDNVVNGLDVPPLVASFGL